MAAAGAPCRLGGRAQAQLRPGGEQAAGVGVGALLEHLLRRPGLDHRAAVHHQQAVDVLGHHAQVVADQQQGHAVFGHQLGDQVEHLALDGDVQRGGGLVGDQHVGPAGQRDGDHHPLALAARQLVRIGLQPLRGLRQLHPLEQAQRLGAGGAGAQALVQAQWLGDLVADAVQRVQRRHRLLEHHGQTVAAQAAPVVLGQAQQLTAVEPDAAGRTGRFGQQAHQRQRGDALAAARFADQAQRLAALQFEGDAAQRVGRSARGGQRDAQVVDGQQGGLDGGAAGHRPASPCARSRSR